MKKLVIAFLLLAILSGCKKEDKPTIVALKAQQLIDKYENDESFVMFVGYGDCEFCADYVETLNLIVDAYQMDIYYFDYDEIETNEDTVRKLINDYLYTLIMTPTTYFVVDGRTVHVVEEKQTYSQVSELLREYGFAK